MMVSCFSRADLPFWQDHALDVMPENSAYPQVMKKSCFLWKSLRLDLLRFEIAFA